MSNIITIAYSSEGTTDKRFLENIIRKTFEEVSFECDGSIEVFDPVYIKINSTGTFVGDMELLSKEAFKIGSNVVCIHVDADSHDDDEVYKAKLNPAFEAIDRLAENACKMIVPIVPVTMSEAWMLADIDLLKEEMGTDLSDQDLNFIRSPERIADPKFLIIEALRISQRHLPKRRSRLAIGDLYQPIGQSISITMLEKLPSYIKFKSNVVEAFKRMNLLH